VRFCPHRPRLAAPAALAALCFLFSATVIACSATPTTAPAFRAAHRAPAGGQAALPAGRAPFPGRARLTRYLTDLAATGQLSGTVLITRGRQEYAAAYGYADRQARTPNAMTTEFRLGSVSKQFTAMAVLILAASGRISLTASICRYLAGCPSHWSAVTVADLLDHTSGIPDYLNELGAAWPPKAATPAQLVASFAAAPLYFRPGTRMRYSNSGYVLAGAIVQKVSHQPLAVFLRQHVFGPLGMARTGTDTTAIRPGHATGYYPNGQRPVAYPMPAFFAAGGLYSDAAGLDRWDTAVQSGTLIPGRLSRAMLSVRIPCPPRGSPGGCITAGSLGYGYGWFIDKTPAGVRWEHEGRIDGYLSYNAIYPARGEHIIVLANSEATPVQAITDELAKLTLG
jgi:CubicO group peptidase (beta-lactamase class C family)